MHSLLPYSITLKSVNSASYVLTLYDWILILGSMENPSVEGGRSKTFNQS